MKQKKNSNAINIKINKDYYKLKTVRGEFHDEYIK